MLFRSKIVCPLDLPHVRYHVCINDCIIYRGEDAEKTTCPVCGVSRYKKGKKAPRKVVWYFPISPRLQRYFADPKEAKLMRWHAERKKPGDDDDPEKDELLTHPSDASQWKALDLEFPKFGGDSRNIRLGASTDGDGRLTDGQGRTVDFKNTILIMTSNLGSQYSPRMITGDCASMPLRSPSSGKPGSR